MRLRWLALPPAVFVLGIAIASCRGPTQVRLVVEADDTVCAKLAELDRETFVSSGIDGKEAQESSPAATGRSCTPGAPGTVGDLYLVPGPSRPMGAPTTTSLQVVVGVRVPTADCVPPSYAGCIVARRRVAFIKASTLLLPVRLGASCIDKPCDPESTCNPETSLCEPVGTVGEADGGADASAPRDATVPTDATMQADADPTDADPTDADTWDGRRTADGTPCIAVPCPPDLDGI